MKDKVNIIDVTHHNLADVGVCCIKNKKALGFKNKVAWFKNKLNEGLKIKIAVDESDKQLGFIEYIPSELAWRPITANQYLFIHCIAMFSKATRQHGIGSRLIQSCEADAKREGKLGVCTMSSKGTWMANKSLFEKNGFSKVDERGRFELMAKKFSKNSPNPVMNDWTKAQPQYTGWNLIYADQCPWHEKSVTDLQDCALEHGVDLKVKRINTPMEAQQAPSGFGVFSLVKDGKLIEDHYISKTRFENILKKELE